MIPHQHFTIGALLSFTVGRASVCQSPPQATARCQSQIDLYLIPALFQDPCHVRAATEGDLYSKERRRCIYISNWLMGAALPAI